ncbi:MAG: pentapeptide repeat-containing protein [Nitrospinales bacterium]
MLKSQSFYEKYKITIIFSSVFTIVFIIVSYFILSRFDINGMRLILGLLYVVSMTVHALSQLYPPPIGESEQKFYNTDTYDNAIKKLNAADGEEPDMKSRLSNIYELEQVARSNKQFHFKVMEFLCAYVRKHSPVTKIEDGLEMPAPQPLRKDIQICLTVIRKRNTEFDGKGILNLKNTDLSFGNLRDADLRKANLSGAKLLGTNLVGANLDRVQDLTCRQIKSSSISLNGEILANDEVVYSQALKIESAHDTILPDYIKVTKSGEHGFVCEMVDE